LRMKVTQVVSEVVSRPKEKTLVKLAGYDINK
jgi:hypothetical protein